MAIDKLLLLGDTEGEEQDTQALVELLRGKVADFWLPDQVAEIAAMPLAATGKIDKNRLRADYARGKIATVTVAR